MKVTLLFVAGLLGAVAIVAGIEWLFGSTAGWIACGIILTMDAADGVCFYKAVSRPAYFQYRQSWWITLTPGGGFAAWNTMRKV